MTISTVMEHLVRYENISFAPANIEFIVHHSELGTCAMASFTKCLMPLKYFPDLDDTAVKKFEKKEIADLDPEQYQIQQSLTEYHRNYIENTPMS